MRSKDFKLPKFTCIVCHLRREGEGPLCFYCMRHVDERSLRAEHIVLHKRNENKGKKDVKRVVHHTRLEGAPFKEDIPILEKLAAGRYHPTFLYNHMYAKQHGCCIRCRRRKTRLKVVPDYGRRRITRLLCKECFETTEAQRNTTIVRSRPRVRRVFRDPVIRASLMLAGKLDEVYADELNIPLDEFRSTYYNNTDEHELRSSKE